MRQSHEVDLNKQCDCLSVERTDTETDKQIIKIENEIYYEKEFYK